MLKLTILSKCRDFFLCFLWCFLSSPFSSTPFSPFLSLDFEDVPFSCPFVLAVDDYKKGVAEYIFCYISMFKILYNMKMKKVATRIG